jgi:hypothetical protein
VDSPPVDKSDDSYSERFQRGKTKNAAGHTGKHWKDLKSSGNEKTTKWPVIKGRDDHLLFIFAPTLIALWGPALAACTRRLHSPPAQSYRVQARKTTRRAIKILKSAGHIAIQNSPFG